MTMYSASAATAQSTNLLSSTSVFIRPKWEYDSFMISKKDYYLILSYSKDKQGLFCVPLSRLCVLNCVKLQNIFL